MVQDFVRSPFSMLGFNSFTFLLPREVQGIEK